MIFFRFFVLILFFTGCWKKEPIANYEAESIKVIYTSSKNLNNYDGKSHSVVLMIYQMNEVQKFDSLTKNVNGIDKLLKNSLEDGSIVSANKYIVNPNENQEIVIDRYDRARYIGIVVGFYEYPNIKGLSWFSTIPTENKYIYFGDKQYGQVRIYLDIKENSVSSSLVPVEREFDLIDIATAIKEKIL